MLLQPGEPAPSANVRLSSSCPTPLTSRSIALQQPKLPEPQLDLFYSALGFATRPAARGPPGGPSELTRLAAYLRGTPAPPAAKGSLTVEQLHLLFASFLAYHGLPLPETLPSPVAAVVGGGDEALPTLVAAATATLTNANAALRGALLMSGIARR